jgi:hypothetical protein
MGAIFANYHRFPTKAQVSTRLCSLSTSCRIQTHDSVTVCCSTAAHFGVFVAERQRRGGRAKQGAHSFAVRVTLQYAFTAIGNVSIVVVSCHLVAISLYLILPSARNHEHRLRRKKENLIAEGIMAHTNNGPGAAPSVSTGDGRWDCLLIGFDAGCWFCVCYELVSLVCAAQPIF